MGKGLTDLFVGQRLKAYCVPRMLECFSFPMYLVPKAFVKEVSDSCVDVADDRESERNVYPSRKNAETSRMTITLR